MSIEDVEIQISLSSDWWRDPPFCEIFLDNKAVDRIHVTSKYKDNEKRQVFFRGNLPFGDHTLTIKYNNKKEDDDIVDVAGQCIHRQMVFLENLIINKVNLNIEKSSLNEKVCFKEGDTIPFQNMLFDNCVWNLKFSVPSYLWLMENS